jgi:hydroxyethylthiazole kinase-like uncharacterized protein yjeF
MGGARDGRPLGFAQRDQDGPPAEPGQAMPVVDDHEAAALLPARPPRAHKGTFGKLLVIAGSLDYAGAALLVCRAAGRAGAGLVTLAIPESLQPLFAAKVVEATTMGLPEDDVEEVDPEPAIARILDHDHDAIVLGPGLRPGLATTELVRLLLHVPGESSDRRPAGASPRSSESPPMVVDAEALRSMATIGQWSEGVTRACVLTPHPGEFARLRAGDGLDPEADGDLSSDDAARAAAAKDAAGRWKQVVVLKGARTVVAEPDGTVAVLPFENPALATGGTGDVLAGIIGALLAQGLGAGSAARLGAYLHGLAGDFVRERLGDSGLLASDLPDAVPLVRKRLAVIAERDSGGKRLGFGVREAAPAASAAGGDPPGASA